MTTRRQSVLLAVATLIFAAFAAYGVCRWRFPFRTVVRPLKLDAAWIAAPGEPAGKASFRQTVMLPGEPRNAWLAIAGEDSFELSVNGRTVSTLPLMRATSPFQKSLSEPGQQVIGGPAMLPRQRSREFQWSGFRSWRVPVFVDLTRFLRPGKNVVCIGVESRTTSARLCVEGEIQMRSGESIRLRSDRDWRATAFPLHQSGQEWTEPAYPDENWAHAALAAPPRGGMLRTFDPGIFRDPFAGSWVQSPAGTYERPVVFETSWRLDGSPREAWLRILTNRAYDLAINGHPVRLPANGSFTPRHGGWLLDSDTPHAGTGRSDAVDPEEVDTIFETESGAGVGSNDAMLPPLALTRNQEVGAFDLYSVPWLLRRGENRITVRLNPTKETLNWIPRFALDAKALAADGTVRTFCSGPGWQSRLEISENLASPAREAAVPGPADIAGAALPRKTYVGNVWDVEEKFRCWLATALAVVLLIALPVTLAARRLAGRARASLTTLLVVSAVPLFVAVLVESSWIEREEALLFLSANAWGCILGVAALVALATGVLLLRPRRERVASGGPAWPRWGSKFALCWILLACAFLRARDLDFQPLDPDEYASVQAIFAIARTGLPQMFDTIYYTRSPLYHYLVGGIVALFGENIWALRLPSVAFAVGTAALLYLVGARLLRSRWTGLVAAALYTIHPFAAFSGHLVRFYQQQQFFALLTAYLFCRGFVVGQGMRARYWMLAAFFATVLSQELSLTIGCSLLLGYVLFAERKRWADEARFAVAAGCVLVLVVLDLAVFQTRCLTRLDGTSPSLEPAFALNFESPTSLLMLFVTFSRLHLALSVLLLLSLPLVLRGHNRAALALHTILFSGVVGTAIFVTGSGLRYQYWLLPLWLVLGVHGVRALAAFFIHRARLGERQPALRHALGGVLIGGVVLAWSPWRLLDSYTTRLQPDSAGALSYVRRNARPGDAIMVSAPHTQSALLEIGRVDYDLAIPLLHDFFYRKDGRLLDRNAGAEAIRNLDMLQDKCVEHQRLWVLVNREDILRSPGKDIRWNLPGGRTDLFLRRNLDLTYRTYLWDVFLWDAAAGRFQTFRRNR